MNLKPNFFIVGAMKSGTSSIHSILADHPEIFMSQPKEPCRFVEPQILKQKWVDMYKEGYCKDEKKYLSLFENAGNAKIIGESSTDYSKLPLIDNVVEKIYAFNPNAKILYIMRNPVNRTISHYWHAVKREGELRNIDQAIQEEPGFINVSDYAMQLTPYIQRFGREQVKAITLEEFNQNTIDHIKQIFQWMGVDEHYIPQNLNEREHETAAEVYQMRDYGVLNKLDLRWLKDKVKVCFPQSVRTLGKSLYQKKIKRKDAVNPQVNLSLQKTFQPKVKELSALLNRDFPEWDLNA